MTPAAKSLSVFLHGILEPPDSRSVVQWAEDEIWLSERQTQNPGPFSASVTPYFREVMNCFSDPSISDLTIVAGTQTGKTNSLMIGAAWRIRNMPTPIVWVMPTETLCKSFSDTRWRPTIEDSPEMKKLMPADVNRFKKLEQQFERCTLAFVGSNSPANLASRPAGLLILDEADKFATASDSEAGAVALAENRTKSFVSPLRVKTSTPTTKEGVIWQEFLKGTQEHYHIPCPHCKQDIILEWEHVKWDQSAKGSNGEWNMGRVKSTAYYICQKCGVAINDGEKAESVNKGRWIPSNLNASPGNRSFHLPSLYSLQKSCTFGALSVQFLQQKKSWDLRDFQNSTLALPWEEEGTGASEDAVLKLRGTFFRDQCPIEPVFVSMGADVADNIVHWSAAAFSETGECYIISWGTCVGTDDLLDIIATKSWTTPSGKQISISCGLVDSGYAATEVYETCSRSNGILHPTKGSGGMFGQLRESDVNGYPTLRLYVANEFTTKFHLFIDRIAKRLPPFLWLAADAEIDFLRSFFGQKIIMKKGGKIKEFKKVHYDHYPDTVRYNLIAWMLLKNQLPLKEAA